MHIIRLEAQNIQRLSAVTIEPDPASSAVVLAGGNEEGKSSTLDAIEMALAGERAIPPEPIRRGADKAHVVVDLGDMIVTRRYTANGTSLTVTNREGLRYPSPQALLDGLYNKLSFDPLAFATAKPDEQARILRQLAGVNTSDLDTTRKEAFDQRTLVNRDVANAKGALEKAPTYEELGTEPEDTAAIVAALDDADRMAKALAEADRVVARAEAARSSAADRVRRASAAVDAARRALEAAEAEQEEARIAHGRADDAFSLAKRDRDEAQRAVPDVTNLRAQLTAAQERNRKIDANVRRVALAEDLARVQAEAAALTRRIEALDAEKAQRLADAKFPLEGLGLSDAGVTWQGLPLEQASTAIRTRVSVAIGMALHPKLKVLLVRNGNDLDAKNLKLLADAAKEAGAQLWVERIAGGEGLQTVVIEDGAVKGAPVATPDGDEGVSSTIPSTESDASAPKGPRRRSSAGLFEEPAQ